MAAWQTDSSEIVYEGMFFKVKKDHVRDHRGEPRIYSVVEVPYPAVAIVAVNNEGKVLLIRNYRYTVGQKFWEVPAGFSEGQDLLEAAKRELMEETGMEGDDWQKLGGTIYSAAGIGKLPYQVFLARNVRQVSTVHDEEEDITERKFFSVTEIESMMKNGEAQNAGLVMAICLAKVYGI